MNDDAQKRKEFKEELIKLCEKHKLVAVPTYELEVSAHDPMYVVPLTDEWLKFLRKRVYVDFE